MHDSSLMEDVHNIIAGKVQELSDIELAVLLCFVAEQHGCVIEADQADLDDVQEEIRLVRLNVDIYQIQTDRWRYVQTHLA
jgi:hypothetical protein